MIKLDEINNVTISLADLWRVNERMVLIHETREPEEDEVFFVIAQEFKDNPEKAMAVSSRMYALARLVSDGIPAWTLPQEPTGAVPVRECLFAAAAVEPLIEVDGMAVFNKETFLRKALQFSEIEGEA